MQLPILVIGLGAVGVQITAQVHQLYQSMTYETQVSLRVIGVDFEAAPASFPPDSYVRLSADFASAFRQLDHSNTPHIRAWFDVERWQSRIHRPQAPARPLERLMWFDNLGRGDRSELYQVWRRQIQAMKTANSILTCVIADLADPIGSSTLMDATFLTRTICDSEGRQIAALWGYTLLPDAERNPTHGVRAFAALREIMRLMQTPDLRFGHPFHYQPSNSRLLDERIWHGSLKTRPFDLWYCFDETQSNDTAATIAQIVASHFNSDLYTRRRSDAANLARRIAEEDGMIVGSANIRSISLPLAQIQTHWSTQVALHTLRGLLFEPDQDEQQQAKQFWQKVPGHRSPEAVQKELERAGSILAFIPQMDEILFAATLGQSAVNLGLNAALRSGTVDEAARAVKGDASARAAAIQAFVQRIGSPSDWMREDRRRERPYHQLAQNAADRLTDALYILLQETVLTMVRDHREAGGLLAALKFVTLLKQQVTPLQARITARLEAHDSKTVEQSYERFDNIYNALQSLLRQPTNWRQRYGQRSRQINDTYKALDDAATHYIDTVRSWVLLAQYQQVVTDFNNALEHFKSQLEQQVTRLREISAAIETLQNQTSFQSMTDSEWRLIDSPDHEWLQQQYNHMVENDGGEDKLLLASAWQWDVKTGLTLSLNNQSLTSAQDLLNQTDHIFRDAAVSCTLLAYLEAYSGNYPLESLVDFLTQADTPLLTLRGSLRAASSFRGYLIMPTGITRKQQQIANDLTRLLRQRYRLAPDNQEFIQQVSYDGRSQLMYLNLTEMIDLQREVTTYDNLKARYHRQSDQQAEQHVFSADVAITHFEQQSPYPRTGEPLHPEVATILHNRPGLRAFLIGQQLQLIETTHHDTGRQHEYSYVLDYEGRRWNLATQTFAGDELLLDALKAFLSSQVSYMDDPLTKALIQLDEAIQFINAAFEGQVHASIARVPNSGDQQLKRWYECLEQVTTPDQTKRRFSVELGRCLLLDEFQQAFLDQAAGTSRFQQDLFQIGAMMLSEEARQHRRDIARSLSDLCFNIDW